MTYPLVQTNAQQLEYHQRRRLRPQSLPRFRVIAATLVHGPEDIFVLRTTSGDEDAQHFARILHIELRVANTRHAAWSLFRQDRHWDAERDSGHEGIVLRHAIWDTTADFARRAFAASQAYPDVTTSMYYVADADAGELGDLVAALDAMLTGGIALSPRLDTATWTWSELTIARLVDWGAMEMTWNYTRQHVACETMIFTIVETMTRILARQAMSGGHVARITMDYDLLPEEVALLVTAPDI